MAHIPQTPASGPQSSGFSQVQMTSSSSSSTWNGLGNSSQTPLSGASSNNTYLMPVSPTKGRRASNEMKKPRIARTCGQRPACLVNASLTYCGGNQIYAFGGFDRDTDEGTLISLANVSLKWIAEGR